MNTELPIKYYHLYETFTGNGDNDKKRIFFEYLSITQKKFV